jgi:hypothetical protein
MTSACNHDDSDGLGAVGKGRRRSFLVKWTAAIGALLGLAVVATGCGGSSGPGVAGPGSKVESQRSLSSSSASKAMGQAVAYARCMRRHGVSHFPDPTPNPGGGFGFQINGTRGSDLAPNNQTFLAAEQACRSLFPGHGQTPPAPVQKIAAEVKWAGCMRSHGVPSFPDPNAQGAFDSSRFDDTSRPFQTASKACKSLEPTGPMSAVPGHGPQ